MGANLNAEIFYFNAFVVKAGGGNTIPMKKIVSILLLGFFAMGCATSNVTSRKLERAAAYAALSSEQRALVDRSEIEIGLPMDAVYIAWGKPSRIFEGQSNSGATTTWIYTGVIMQEQRYWNYNRSGLGYSHTPTLDYKYIPGTYVAAEVVFENGLVQSFREAARSKRH